MDTATTAAAFTLGLGALVAFLAVLSIGFLPGIIASCRKARSRVAIWWLTVMLAIFPGIFIWWAFAPAAVVLWIMLMIWAAVSESEERRNERQMLAQVVRQMAATQQQRNMS